MPNSFCIAMFYNNYITYRYFLFGFWTMGHPLQIIRVKKVTGNLNFLWLINTPYSKMLAIIGPVYREVEDFGRWGNPLRWDNPHCPCNLSFYFEPGAHLLERATSTAFSRTSFFSERFWREFRTSFKSHKPVSKTYRPKKDYNFCLFSWWRYVFVFAIIFILRMRS